MQARVKPNFGAASKARHKYLILEPKFSFRAEREIWAKIKIGRESLLHLPARPTTPSPPDPLCCHLRRRLIPADSGDFSRRRPPPPRACPDSWRGTAAPPQTLSQDSGFTEEQELPVAAAADSVKQAEERASVARLLPVRRRERVKDQPSRSSSRPDLVEKLANAVGPKGFNSCSPLPFSPHSFQLVVDD